MAAMQVLQRWSVRLLLLAFLTLFGCYSYVPVDFGISEQGHNVRAELNAEGEQALTNQLGPGIHEIQGMVLGQEGESLSILIQSARSTRLGIIPGGNEAIRLGPMHVNRFYEKRLSRGRSIILGAVVVAGLAFLTSELGSEDRVLGPENPGDPGDPELRGHPRFPIGLIVPVGR
jgi:hypothetical protein